MAVHVDQSWKHPLTGHVVLVRVTRDRDVGARPDLADTPPADKDCLVIGAGLTDYVDDRRTDEGHRSQVMIRVHGVPQAAAMNSRIFRQAAARAAAVPARVP